MTFRIRLPSLRTRLQSVLRYTSYVFLLVGVAVLTYVGLAVLDARFFQIDANRTLDNEIRLQQGSKHKVTIANQVVKDGDILGRIEIPRLGVSVVVLQGTTSHLLRLGVGHIEHTPLPWELGNSGIAGHRDTFFRALKDVQPNDEIQLQTVGGILRYQVDWVKVVAPNDMTVLDPSTDSTLTLVTCYPFYLVGAAPNRFVVHASRK